MNAGMQNGKLHVLTTASQPTFIEPAARNLRLTYHLSVSFLDKITWETVNDLGSDHKPIILTYEDEMIKVNNKPRFKWKMKDAEWETFKNDIEQDIPSKYHTKDVNKLEKKFRKIITKSAKKNIGKKKISHKTKPWMTTEIKESIKARNELRKAIT